MEPRTAFLQFVALLLSTWGEAQGFFNTDTRDPVVRLSPANMNMTHVETFGRDFFGFAFAFLTVEDILETDGPLAAANKTRVIVGAPWGTFPGGTNLVDRGQPALPNTGLVYSCSITAGNDQPCEGVVGDDAEVDDDDNDGLRPAGRLFDQRPNAIVNTVFESLLGEQKIGQFMGATVYSRDGVLLVCAPGWISTGFYHPNVEDPDEVKKKNNRPVKTNALPQGRCYMMTSSLKDITFFDPCNLQGEADVTVDEGYCNAGTDIDILESGRIAIGSPGFDLGMGTVFYGRTHIDMTERGKTTVGAGNSNQPRGDRLERILDSSQAFQLTAAYITFRRNESEYPPNIVASAPRYDSTQPMGSVNVYDAREAGGNIKNLLSITAEGRQMAEFFGYALAALDLNGDMYDDIVVGAPMYSTINTAEINVEVGRAYVYMNTGGDFAAEPIIFEGREYRGRFGMSVVNIGDIDLDGYEDVAIGAPYEVNGDSTGVVYVYYGSNNLELFRNQTPGRISAQEVADRLTDVNNFTTFGFSLSSFDIDNNKHNDLGIGVLDTGAIILLRSRPVAKVDVTVTASAEAVVRMERSCSFDEDTYPCFDITVELDLSGLSIPNEIEVTVVVREVEVNGEPRAFFASNPGGNVINRTLLLNPTRSFTDRVYVENDITDSFSPIKIVAEVQQHQVTQPRTPSDGNSAFDPLNDDYIIREPAIGCTTVNLTNNCGSENICETDFSLSLDGVIFVPKRDTNTVFESIELDGVKEVKVQLTLANRGAEDAIILSLSFTHSDPNVFSDRILLDSGETCTNDVPCSIGQLGPGESRMVTVTMVPQSNAPLVTMETTITLVAASTVVDLNPNNNRVSQEFTINRQFDLSVEMILSQNTETYTNMQVSAPADRDDVGMAISLEVRVRNTRSASVDGAVLTIYYPARAEETGDNYYLLPDCQTTPSSREIMCEDSVLAEIDSLPCDANGRKKRHSPKQRYLREARSSGSNGGLHRRVRQSGTTLDCSDVNDRRGCLMLECTIPSLSGLSVEHKVTLAGYIDTRFFNDKDGEYRLTAYAEIEIDEIDVPDGVTNLGRDEDFDSETLTLTPQQSTSRGSEDRTTLIIVIVVVVLLSILLVIIIGIVLYCCGFFKRKKKVLDENTEVEVQPVPAPLNESQKLPQEGTTL